MRPDPGLRSPRTERERDGIHSLHDVDSESGDEDEVEDLFVLDRAEAHALGVDLTPYDEAEAPLG